MISVLSGLQRPAQPLLEGTERGLGLRLIAARVAQDAAQAQDAAAVVSYGAHQGGVMDGSAVRVDPAGVPDTEVPRE